MNARMIHPFTLSVDLVDANGRPIRVPYGFDCRAGEVGALPVAGLFQLKDGRRLEYRDLDGRPMLRTYIGEDDTPEDGLTARRTYLSSLRVPRDTPIEVHGITGEPFTDAMFAPSELLDDPSLGSRYGAEAIAAMHARAEKARAVFASRIVLSEGLLYADAPLPAWRTHLNLATVSLQFPRRYEPVQEIEIFAAGRLDAAVRFAELHAHDDEQVRVEGMVEMLTPGFGTRDDLGQLVGIVRDMLEDAVVQARRHNREIMIYDLAKDWASFRDSPETKPAAEIVAEGLGLMERLEEHGHIPLPQQKELMTRLRQIEGVGTAPAAGSMPTP